MFFLGIAWGKRILTVMIFQLGSFALAEKVGDGQFEAAQDALDESGAGGVDAPREGEAALFVSDFKVVLRQRLLRCHTFRVQVFQICQ